MHIKELSAMYAREGEGSEGIVVRVFHDVAISDSSRMLFFVGGDNSLGTPSSQTCILTPLTADSKRRRENVGMATLQLAIPSKNPRDLDGIQSASTSRSLTISRYRHASVFMTAGLTCFLSESQQFRGVDIYSTTESRHVESFVNFNSPPKPSLALGGVATVLSCIVGDCGSQYLSLGDFAVRISVTVSLNFLRERVISQVSLAEMALRHPVCACDNRSRQ